MRPGIYGSFVDGSSGRELDRVGGIFGCEREPARFFGYRLPWGQMDETYRRRIWDHVQASSFTRRATLLASRPLRAGDPVTLQADGTVRRHRP